MSMIQICILWYKKSDRCNLNDYYLSDYYALHKSGLDASTSRKKIIFARYVPGKNSQWISLTVSTDASMQTYTRYDHSYYN